MDSMWVQIPLSIGLAIPIVLLIGGSIYYGLIHRDGPEPDYRHISHMEHDVGFLPCSWKSCTTCYPKAVTEAPVRSYDYNPWSREFSLKSEYRLNSLVQDSYNKQIEMEMRNKIYFDVDPSNPRRVSISNGTHGMVVDRIALESIGEEAMKDRFLKEVQHLSRNTRWEISSPLTAAPLPDPRIEGWIKK
jgi:hypothetical protein